MTQLSEGYPDSDMMRAWGNALCESDPELAEELIRRMIQGEAAEGEVDAS